MGVAISKCGRSEKAHRMYDEKWAETPQTGNDNFEIPSPVTIRDIKAASIAIDESLEKEKLEQASTFKILLLGGSDAGKSTILKQMRILHMNGFSSDEMRSFRKHLKLNIFHEIAKGIQDLNADIADEEKNIIYRFAGGVSWVLGFDDEQEIDYLLDFLAFDSVQTFLGLYPNYSSLPDNAHYFTPKLSLLLAPDYVPTAEDILHLRIPTTSVAEINFSFEKKSIRLIDVGGQRTYRKKWMHHFDGVAAVLFVVSMAAYDQALEDVDKSIKPVLHKDVISSINAIKKRDSRLRDSVQLYGDMLRSKYLLKSAFILFLNKKDLFFKKLHRHPLDKYMNGYKGRTNQDAAECLKQYFLKRKSKSDKDRPIYPHFTCATDTNNVEFVFKAACEIIRQKNLNNSGIHALIHPFACNGLQRVTLLFCFLFLCGDGLVEAKGGSAGGGRGSSGARGSSGSSSSSSSSSHGSYYGGSYTKYGSGGGGRIYDQAIIIIIIALVIIALLIIFCCCCCRDREETTTAPIQQQTSAKVSTV